MFVLKVPAALSLLRKGKAEPVMISLLYRFEMRSKKKGELFTVNAQLKDA